MKNEIQIVYIPVCYGEIKGVYASQDDALQVVNDCIAHNRPCNLIVKSVVYPLKG